MRKGGLRNGNRRTRIPQLATVLSLLGIAVVGLGLAYSLHASAQLGERRAAGGLDSSAGTPVNRHVSGVAITPGRELIGAIRNIDQQSVEVSSPTGTNVKLALRPETQVTTTHGNELSDLSRGDVVMIQISSDGKSALAIYSGQISVAGTPSFG